MLHPSRILPRITSVRARYFHASARRSRRVTTQRSRLVQTESLFKISPEVRDAIETGKPVVALETTIYTHGFPYPDNVSLAAHLESVVRNNGGVPATIGILEGQAHVGMTADQLLAIAEAAGKAETMKVSRRDIPYILGMGIAGRKLTGGTTIAGTMFLANKANIHVFGTGGLGGVHRGGQDSMDISADLTELGRTPVAVVSSGCKSFLDIPRTLEYLETQGAGVFTFADGRSGKIDFPAFWTRESGIPSPMVVQNEKEAAAMIYSQLFFPNSSGLHFANPIPEEFSIPKEEIDSAIEQAVQEAAEQGIHGHRNTPFILARIKELTKGNSIPANWALIESNVARATKIAVEFEKLRLEREEIAAQTLIASSAMRVKVKQTSPTLKVGDDAKPSKIDIIVAGSVAMDLSCDHTTAQEPPGSDADASPLMHTSNRAQMRQSIGGVGHNVALAAHHAAGNLSVQLRSLVADDGPGNFIINLLKAKGFDIRGIKKLYTEDNISTAQYVAVNDGKKDLVLAMADMSIFTKTDNKIKRSLIKDITSTNTSWMIIDGNWSPAIIRFLIKSIPPTTKVAFEPVSVVKSAGLFEPSDKGVAPLDTFPNNKINLATPNQHELEAMHAAAKKHEWFESESWWKVIDALGISSSGARNRFVALTNAKMTDAGIPLQTIQLLPFIPTIITKLGAEGVLLTELLPANDPRLTDPEAAPYILSRCNNGTTDVGGVYMRLFPAVEVVQDVVSVNGVGDTFLGVLIAGLARGLPLNEKLVHIAQKGAVMTLRSKEAVSPKVTTLSNELDQLATDAGLQLSPPMSKVVPINTGLVHRYAGPARVRQVLSTQAKPNKKE